MLLDTWSFVRYIFTDLIGFCYFVLPVLLTFGVQLLLCFKAKRVIFKLLAYLIRREYPHRPARPARSPAVSADQYPMARRTSKPTSCLTANREA